MTRRWCIPPPVRLAFALGVVIAGCGGGDRSKPPDRPVTQRSDTVAVIRYDGTSFSLTVPVELGREFAGFQRFLDSTRSRPGPFAAVRVVDVTGDGNPDTCRTDVRGVGGGILVTHRIHARSAEIWLDTMTIDHETAKTLFWYEDSSYARFGTSILYYNAARYYTDFVGDPLHTGGESLKNMGPIVSFLEKQATEREYWQRYLSAFRGRFIEKLNLVDVTKYLWDARTRRFILFDAP